MDNKSTHRDLVCSGTQWTGNFPAQHTVHWTDSDPLEPGTPAVHGIELEEHNTGEDKTSTASSKFKNLSPL